MVNRPAGGARSKVWDAEPYDWYREGPRPVEQLMDAIDFGDDLIYDPTCGVGNILDVAKKRGHPTFGSDIIDRHPRHQFKRVNFLEMQRPPRMEGRNMSIINNPPYSYMPDICEKIIRKAISLDVRHSAFLVPIAFMCGAGRRNFFAREFPPSHVCILTERPSCPPGSTVDEHTTFKGGMADYIWLIYTRPHRWRTQTLWLKPD